MKIEFVEGVGNSLEFQTGEYSRSFARADQPFEVTAEEWNTLSRTHFFQPVNETAQTQSENQPTGEEQSTGDETEDVQPPAQPPAQPKRTGRKAQNNQHSEEK